ncbi:class I SAM-dependent methyltransferase [Actinomadura sp. WMMB 499]|uniref:class I SAM-dependent methyltransferase n=1 Tax=Actinomadura sp. WMMB 499 TaxID=1219491 RepID=UPI001246F4B9|nr:class I SAM-dependent methyltransferase [Actinomadura sp. WMMB 499]QFG22929.1 class I SAM-dependent methyltransferase [Actinomadura sp. WMMB 499]
MSGCRVCGGPVHEFADFGRQPLSDAFVDPGGTGDEFLFRLAVGRCARCRMVQLTEPVPRERMFRYDYPYRSSQSARMRRHFDRTARTLLAGLPARDPFVVEIGCNDGGLMPAVDAAGVRSLGVDPSVLAAKAAADRGLRVRTEFFDAGTAAAVRAAEGPADLIYSANTISHIDDLASVFAGVDRLLAPAGRFVFEDPYLGDVLSQSAFDQVIDEHFYLFAVGPVRDAARRFGFDLVDVEPLPVHGGEMRFTVARPGRYRPTPAVGAALAREDATGLTGAPALRGLAAGAERVRAELPALLRRLRAGGRVVAGYGATAKSATVTNYCGIGPELVAFVCDSTPGKQGLLTPGSRIPVRPPEAFADPYPDYAVLFAWNHAEEIMAKERGFRAAGGRWIRYVPDVRVV